MKMKRSSAKENMSQTVESSVNKVLLKAYPYAIVWAPIPVLSWILPCVGHMGICSSEGVVFDFAGPFIVQEGRFLFGNPTRYLPLDPRQASCMASAQSAAGTQCEAGQLPPEPSSLASSWDMRLRTAAEVYRGRMYNLCTDNCHCFVADMLNSIDYKRSSWNMVDLAAVVFLKARFTSWFGFFYTLAPFCIICGLGAYFGRLIFLYAYLGLAVPILAWFVLYTYLCWRPLNRASSR